MVLATSPPGLSRRLRLVIIANTNRVVRARLDDQTVAERWLEKRIAIDDFRGAGRIDVP
jgi:regulator of extracellular matrix RemA (YlzA/DUF370 family)